MFGLNRTSVGLKRRSTNSNTRSRHRPQSNQRGIETVFVCSAVRGLAGPQSNQRGIETAVDGARPNARARGLNRTSVGLKPTAAR